MGSELARIGYVGDGPNTFQEFPISAHFEIHVEQATTLEKAGKPIGWVEGWQGMTWCTWPSESTTTFAARLLTNITDSLELKGENGHANTYPMYGRRDALVGAGKIISELDALAYKHNGRTTVTNILSGPWGACNIQSDTKLSFCLMHWEADGLDAMGKDIEASIKGISSQHGLETTIQRDIHLHPGDFWPDAVDCVRRACGDKGMASRTGTGHDSTMTQLLVPTGMVFARAKDGISHSPKEWSDKEDCTESALALGKAVLNFDELMKTKKDFTLPTHIAAERQAMSAARG